MGDMDLLKPVAMAGIPCAVMTRPGVPSLYSRHARTRLPWEDFSKDPEALLETLLRFGKAQNARPVLFYEEDAQPLFVSRHRERLKEAFRFVVADATLVEDLLDKARFQDRAQRHGLSRAAGAATDRRPGIADRKLPLLHRPDRRHPR